MVMGIGKELRYVVTYSCFARYKIDLVENKHQVLMRCLGGEILLDVTTMHETLARTVEWS